VAEVFALVHQPVRLRRQQAQRLPRPVLEYRVQPRLDPQHPPGHQRVANTPGFSYADWKLGVTRAFSHGYSVALGYYDTNAKRTAYTNAYGHFVGRATGVLTLSKAF